MSISAAPSRPSVLPSFLRKGTKAYDLLAALPLAAWFATSAGGAVRLLAGTFGQFLSHPDLTGGLTIVARSAVLLFAIAAIGMLAIRKPPSAAAKGIGPRIASILGTYINVAIVILLPAATVPNFVLAVSALLILGGMGFSLYAILHLGQSFSLIPEARSLVITGPYAHVRHPLYVGEEMAIIGATLLFISPLAVALLVLQIACQFYRMDCEEAVLEQAFPDYGAYRAHTARLIPGIY